VSEVAVSPAAILDRQRDHEAPVRGHTCDHARHVPIVPMRAEGMTVYGADGRAYLDCLSGAGTLALGHNHPVVVEAVRRVLDSGAPLHALDLATPIRDEFTETLLGVLPPALAKDARIHSCGSAAAEHVHGVLGAAGALIADETLTGLGRTGELWGVEHTGVTPDVMILPTAIGGGLPLAVIAYRAELDPWIEAAHRECGYGHQLAMAAGTATIKYVVEHDLATRARKVGERLRVAFEEAARDLPALGGVRGRGLMLGVELVDPDSAPDASGARTPAPALARAVRAEALERGLLTELGGDGATLRLLPPLTVTDQEADRVVELLLDAVAAVSAVAVIADAAVSAAAVPAAAPQPTQSQRG
jgi:diaminobutyrate-2-oxoglutarate transaminase